MVSKSDSLSINDLYTLSRFAVCRDKKYYEKSWQLGKTFAYCEQQLKIGKPNGYGIITGEFDGIGIVAIDFDGDSADQIAKAIGSWLLEIDTMAWTSNKKGHYQIAFVIPKKHLGLWSDKGKVDLKEYKKRKTINGDHLEIRYKSCASVLPSSVHPETGYYQWIKEIAPRELTIEQSFSLLNCFYSIEFNNELSIDDEIKMIEVAVGHIPNDDYDTWINVGMALSSHKNDLFTIWDNWSASSEKYKANEMASKWQSFKNRSGFSLGTVFFLAKDNGFDQVTWMRNNLKSNIKRIERSYTKSDEAIGENFLPKLFSEIIERLSDSSITEDDRQLQIGQFCSQHKINPNLIQKALDAKIKANEQTIAIDSFSADLTNLISVPNEKLDLNYIFGDFFGEAIKSIAIEIPTNPDAIATVLLPTLASVIGTRSRIIVNPNTRYIVPFILRNMIVAKSGAKKSPTLRLATSPLDELNTLEYAKYKQNKKEYDNSTENIKPPILKRLIVKDSTIDGLIKAHQNNPQGFLCEVDELSGYFKRMNKFYQGDDLQRDLELYEGKSLIKTRASDESDVFLPRTAISIVGTIQEVMLHQILANKDDLSGVSARWLIWAGKMPLGKAIDRKSNKNSFSDNLKTLLENLINQDIDSDLLIDDQAYEIWRQWQNDIMDQLVNLSSPQLENKYSKIESDVIKFAGILHYFFMNVQPSLITNDNVINAEIMTRAIALGNYYLRHFAYIVTKCQENELNSQLLKIIELVQKKNEITAQDVKRFIREFKTTPINEINVLLLELVKLKKVEQISTQKGLKIKIL